MASTHTLGSSSTCIYLCVYGSGGVVCEVGLGTKVVGEVRTVQVEHFLCWFVKL